MPFATEWVALLALVPLVGGVSVLYRLIECQSPGCRRIGKHPLKHLRLCGLHHPQVPPGGVTVKHIQEA